MCSRRVRECVWELIGSLLATICVVSVLGLLAYLIVRLFWVDYKGFNVLNVLNVLNVFKQCLNLFGSVLSCIVYIYPGIYIYQGAALGHTNLPIEQDAKHPRQTYPQTPRPDVTVPLPFPLDGLLTPTPAVPPQTGPNAPDSPTHTRHG